MGFYNTGDPGGINFGNSSRLIAANANALTFCAWIKLDDTSDQGIFDCTRGPSTSSRMEIAVDSGQFYTSGRGADDDSFQLYSAGTPTTDLMHLACVNDYENDTALIYVNGVLTGSQGSMGWSYPTSNTAPIFCIFAAYNSAGGSGAAIGQMHDARLYKCALTAEEISTIYACRGNDFILHDIDLWVRCLERNDPIQITISNTIEQGPNKYAPIAINGTVQFQTAPLSYRRRV